MTNLLEKYVSELVENNGIKTKSDFANLLNANKEITNKIIEAAIPNDAVHFTESTYDGWYCIKNNHTYEVYYQERGNKQWKPAAFKEAAVAVAALLNQSGYTSF